MYNSFFSIFRAFSMWITFLFFPNTFSTFYVFFLHFVHLAHLTEFIPLKHKSNYQIVCLNCHTTLLFSYSFTKNDITLTILLFLLIKKRKAIWTLLLVNLEYSSYTNNLLIWNRRSILNTFFFITCMNNCVISHINGNMSTIANNISRLHFWCTHFISHTS